MAVQLLRNVFKPNFQRNAGALGTSYNQLRGRSNDANKAEPLQIDIDVITNSTEVEHRKKLTNVITVIGKDDISPVSGIPEEHIKGRRVRIYQFSKSAMQSGTDKVGTWSLDFDTRERWENPLIGWTSTGDPLSNMKVEFCSEEDAINFAEKNGWQWFIDEGTPVQSKVKSYGFNFSWDKRTRVSTK